MIYSECCLVSQWGQPWPQFVKFCHADVTNIRTAVRLYLPHGPRYILEGRPKYLFK